MDIEKVLQPVKLRHLDLIAKPEPDYSKVMVEVYNYSNNWLSRKWNFITKFKKAFMMVNTLQTLDPTKLELTENCPIKMPDNIDFITFQAMVELRAWLNSGIDEEAPADTIAHAIAIACYQSHLGEKKYESDGKKFEEFKEWILNQNYLRIFPVFNWIAKSLEESNESWNERFESVEINDEDWDRANGSRMSQFNIIQTLKSICQEFNLPLEEAWQVSYNMVQTNSYANATLNRIQDDMRILKEIKMKQQRNSQP